MKSVYFYAIINRLQINRGLTMNSFSEVWEQVLILCKKKINEVSLGLWVSTLTPVKFENAVVTLGADTYFKKDIVMDKFFETIQNTFSEVMGFNITLRIIILDDTENPYEYETENLGDEKYPEERQEFTFDNFVVGSSNKFAHAASLRVAEAPGKAYNPLFIYGRSGLGKTHLLLAIESAIKEKYPRFETLYTTSEKFTNELISCIAEKNTAAFHNKYRNVDALLVDDIQFIQKKEAAQEEFFHTFNTLIQDKKQVVMTSDKPPKELDILDERLRTRFEWGLLADIQPPDIDTRMAIIKRMVRQQNLKIPDAVIEYMAEKIKSNIRQLEGTVKKISAERKLNEDTPLIKLAEKVVNEIITDNQPISVKVENIIKTIADHYNISPGDIKSEKKSANISQARQISMYVLREATDLPLQSIGEFFGGKNHSTVHYSIETVEKKMKKDAAMKNTVYGIIEKLQE